MLVTPDQMAPAAVPVMEAGCSWSAKLWALLEADTAAIPENKATLVEWCEGRTHFRINLNLAEYVGGGRLFGLNSIMAFHRQLNL